MKNLLLLAQQIHIDGIPQVDASAATLANVFSVASAVAGGISILFILIGAGRYAVSGGDSGELTKARNTILYALIGLIVSTSSFLIVQFILGRLNNP